MTTFAPKQPDLPLAVSHKPRVLNSAMGDGYVQRIRDGINSDLPTIALTWTALYQAEATYINDFFKTRYGVTAFEYQPPHIDYSAQAKFVVQDWSVTKTHGSSFDVTATLQQVADPT